MLLGDDVVRFPVRLFRTLVELAQRPNTVVTCEKLLHDVWGVDPLPAHRRRLRVAVSSLRRLLGHGPQRPRIETVVRVGYRLATAIAEPGVLSTGHAGQLLRASAWNAQRRKQLEVSSRGLPGRPRLRRHPVRATSPADPTTLQRRLPPPTTIRPRLITAASTQIGSESGAANGVTPPIVIPVNSVVESAGANDALRVPSRARTALLTSRRVVANTRQRAKRGGSLLPITTMAFAESSKA